MIYGEVRWDIMSVVGSLDGPVGTEPPRDEHHFHLLKRL